MSTSALLIELDFDVIMKEIFSPRRPMPVNEKVLGAASQHVSAPIVWGFELIELCRAASVGHKKSLISVKLHSLPCKTLAARVTTIEIS